jgi:hypothetical protein
VAVHQIGSKRWQSVAMAFRPSILDGNVPTFKEFEMTKARLERHVRECALLRLAGTQISN